MFVKPLLGRYFRLLILALCLFLVLGLSVQAMADIRSETPYTLHFGVFSYLGDDETRRKYTPLVQYLNSVLEQEQIELHVLSQEDLNERISQNLIDFVTTNPTHFLVARSQYPLTGVIATLVQSYEGKPENRLGGAILTLAHRTDIATLHDLGGKIVATPSRDNLGGYRAQLYELYTAGVDIHKDAFSIIELGTHQAALEAVLDGRADIAFVRDGIMEQMYLEGLLPEKSVKLLNAQLNTGFAHKVSTRLYPEWPVFALPHVDERAVRHVAAALYSLEPDHPLAQQAGIFGFTVPADYQSVEILSRSLRLPPYEALPDFTLKDAWERWQIFIFFAGLAMFIIVLLSLLSVWFWRKALIERSRFSTLLQGLGEGVYGVDDQGRCTFINDAAMQMLQVNSADVIGRDQHRLFHHHHVDGRVYLVEESPIIKTLCDGRKRQLKDWFVRHDGSHLPVEITVSPLFNKALIQGAVVAFSDMTERIKIDYENRRLTEYNRLLLESAGDGIYGIDMQGLCTFMNPAALKMLGLIRENVIGRDPHLIFHYRFPDGTEYPHEKCPVYTTMVKGIEQECEDHFIRNDSELFPVHLKVSPVYGEKGQVGVVVVFQDITQQKTLQSRLIKLTTTDDLTGLYNRRYFQEQLSKDFARFKRVFTENAVLMIDVDHFKQINDTYGHAAGDRVLKDFSKILSDAQRSSDLSARVGGEEFAMLLPGTSIKDALSFADRLRNRVKQFEFVYKRNQISLTVSIGCTTMRVEDAHPDAVLARADRALYIAKEKGRDRVIAYNSRSVSD